MKKVFLFVSMFFFTLLLSAQNENSNSSIQILLPKTAYTGDRCELKYVFHTNVDLLGEYSQDKKIQSLELTTDFPAFNKLEQKCQVYRVTLEHSGFEYTLSVFFIPWQSGIIDFQPFDLFALVRKSLNKNSSGEVFSVDLAPVTINSLAQKMGVTSLCPSKGPMILPGTTFLLILLVACVVACLAILIFILSKIPYFVSCLILGRRRRQLKKSYRQTERLFKRSLKEKIDDCQFCQQISTVLRLFLSERFDSDFMFLTDDKLSFKFEEITCGSTDELKSRAICDVVEVLQRCSYIRFAKGSIDSKKLPRPLYETELAEGERELLVRRCLEALRIFIFETSKNSSEEGESK